MTTAASNNPFSRWAPLLGGVLAAIFSGLLQAAGPVDSAYRIINDGVPLIQVFDDGSTTFLVLGRNTNPKLVEEMARSLVVTRGGETVAATLVPTSPNPSIAGVYDRISVAAGGHRAIALYGGKRSPEVPAAKPMAAADKAATAKPAAAQAAGTMPAASPAGPKAAGPSAAAPPGRTKEATPNAQADAAAEEVAAFKVTVPFVPGKTVLGKEAEKATKEIAEVGPIAREILIRVPGDPSGDLTIAHGRAAELHRLLVKMGLLRQRIIIETFKPAPDGRIPSGEVTLFVDLNQKHGAK